MSIFRVMELYPGRLQHIPLEFKYQPTILHSVKNPGADHFINICHDSLIYFLHHTVMRIEFSNPSNKIFYAINYCT